MSACIKTICPERAIAIVLLLAGGWTASVRASYVRGNDYCMAHAEQRARELDAEWAEWRDQ